jgi:predicted O-methyltransferase YrrM
MSKTATDLMAKLHAENPYHHDEHEGYNALPKPQVLTMDKTLQMMIRGSWPRLIIEVGSWTGASAVTMATVLDDQDDMSKEYDHAIICVDTWLGSTEHLIEHQMKQCGHEWDIRPYTVNGRPQLYQQFLANVLHYGVHDIIVPFPATSRVASRVLRYHGVTADFVYIDAGHEEEDVYDDLIHWWPLVTPGGIMAGDDFDLAWVGVVCAVNRFAKKRGLTIRTIDSKWMLQKWSADTPIPYSEERMEMATDDPRIERFLSVPEGDKP